MINFKSCQNLRIYDDQGHIANGNYILEKVQLIIRINNGYLNDEIGEKGIVLPAVETFDNCYVEHWKNGILHCEKEPAIIDVLANHEEWWLNGRIIEEER